MSLAFLSSIIAIGVMLLRLRAAKKPMTLKKLSFHQFL